MAPSTTSFATFPLLSQDLVTHLASFLDGCTLMCLALSCRGLHTTLLLKPSAPLWRDLLSRDVNGTKLLQRRRHKKGQQQQQPQPQQQRQQQQPPQPQEEELMQDHELYAITHRLAHLSSSSPIAWQQLPRVPLSSSGNQNVPPPMEGHTACLLNERWLVVVGGFSRYGVRNDVFVLDSLAALDKPHPQWRRYVLPRRTDGGMPVYGHVCCALSSRHVAVLGGVTMGGYMGDVNDFHILEIEPENETVRLSRPTLLGQPLTSRAYASLTFIPPNRLLVLGGIHEGSAILCPEVLTLLPLDGDVMEGPWEVVRPAPVTQQLSLLNGPGPRMGHSCTYLPATQRLVVVGGSDGSDLLRNGRELLQEVFFLRLDQHNKMEWSVPSWVHRDAPTGREQTFTGRTHTAHLLHDGKILLFGGDARLSDAVGLLEVGVGADQDAIAFYPLNRLVGPRRRPGPRVSHAAVLVGESLLVHGGWCEYEKGDLHRLWLTPTAGMVEAGGEGEGGGGGWEGLGNLDLDAEVYMSDDDEEEEEEEDDDDSTYYGSSSSVGEEEESEEEEEEASGTGGH